MQDRFLIQRQVWHEFTRYLIASEYGSVQVELYATEQDWNGFKGTTWIYGLWVDPEWRRQGVAKSLLTKAEDAALSAGHKSVFLEWKEQDTPKGVLDWYKSQGYEELSVDCGYSMLRKIL